MMTIPLLLCNLPGHGRRHYMPKPGCEVFRTRRQETIHLVVDRRTHVYRLLSLRIFCLTSICLANERVTRGGGSPLADLGPKNGALFSRIFHAILVSCVFRAGTS
jgi:hypothetical protein